MKGRKEYRENVRMQEREEGHDGGISLMWERNRWNRKELCKLLGISV
jgi:hypothetical protein